MPTRDTAPTGAPCWVDLMTSDVERARAFYGELFGWTSDEPNAEFGGYFNFSLDGVLVAGGMPAMPEAGPPNIWSIYLAADDARKVVEVATANGAQVIAPAMDVSDMGTMAVMIDPTGAVIGTWQPGTHKGFGIHAETNAPSWFELHTKDHAKAVEFYKTVFGWNTNAVGDTDDFRYTTAMDGELMLAGVMDASAFLPEEVPSHWSVYFGADDADVTIAKLVELGGSVLEPAQDTPYGRLATVADPMGARFKLVSPKLADPPQA
jgi:predicted enzyme related to lactoylglutathione lyase